MILEFLINALFGCLDFILNLFPTFGFEIPAGMLLGLSHILYGVGWFLPLRYLLPILYASAVFASIRLCTAIGRLIMRVVPGMDGG